MKLMRMGRRFGKTKIEKKQKWGGQNNRERERWKQTEKAESHSKREGGREGKLEVPTQPDIKTSYETLVINIDWYLL